MPELNSSAFRVMPHSLEAEMSVLGAILFDSQKLNDIAPLLKADDFYGSDNREIYETLLTMFNMGKNIDLITVMEELRSRGVYEKVGGREFLAKLLDIVPTAQNALTYARIVQEKSSLRRLLKAAEEITNMCIEQEGEPKDILDLSEQMIYDLSRGRNITGFATMKDTILEIYEKLHVLSTDKNAFAGVKTGFSDLDRKLIGLSPSDLVLVAARPGMGKTAFALNVAQNVAKRDGGEIAVFSLEMSREQLVMRMLSSEAHIDSEKLRTGELSNEDWTNLARATESLAGTQILIDDTSGINVVEMKAKCRRLKNLKMIVIDYLQLMQSPRHTDNRVQEISEISRSLKLMARELNVPVICLSQLSRGPETRTDKRPMLSDLRESGAIEQDADIVLMLYRDDYYNPDTERRNICECIVAKNRHGETGKAELVWVPQYTLFTSMERSHYEG